MNREHLQIAERWFRLEKARRTKPCGCTSYRSAPVGAGVEVRCIAPRGGPGCGYAVWWPSSALETRARAVA